MRVNFVSLNVRKTGYLRNGLEINTLVVLRRMSRWELHSIELTSVIVTYEPEVGVVQDGSMIKCFHV